MLSKRETFAALLLVLASASLAAAHVSLSPISSAHMPRRMPTRCFWVSSSTPVLDAVRIGRRARHLMQQNLLRVIYNAIAVPIAIAGFVTPLIAAVAMSGSSILVTVNALRARPGRADPTPLPAHFRPTGAPEVRSP